MTKLYFSIGVNVKLKNKNL